MEMEKSELVNTELHKFIQGTRVIEGYDAVTELWNLLCPLFGDTRVLQRTGLVAQINTLKTKVINEGLISLIIYGSTLNDDRVRLVQFGQKGYYVLDFKRLNQLYDRDDINLTSRLVYGKTSDGIKIPKVIIYDNETNTDLLTIRMFRNAAGYVRNYIEKEALMVKLTKVRGTK